MSLIDKEYPNSTEMKQLSFNSIIFLVYIVFLLISQFLPLSTAADQLLIAYRVADELGLGFRLNPKKTRRYSFK